MLNEERGQKVNKLKIVEKECSNLSSAKEEAEEFMSQQRKLLTKKATLYQVCSGYFDKAVRRRGGGAVRKANSNLLI